MIPKRPNKSGDKTRAKLLKAAVKLFAQRGFYGVSLRDIGGELNMGNSSLLHHYPSKETIYAAVLQTIEESFQSVPAAVLSAPEGASRLSVLFDAYLDWTLAHPAYGRILTRELLDNARRIPKSPKVYFAQTFRALGAMIGEGLPASDEHDPELLVLHVFGTTSYLFAAMPTLLRIKGQKKAQLIAQYRVQTRALLSAWEAS